MDRRYFIKTSGIGLASFGFMAAAPEFLHQFAAAQTSKGFGSKKVLVTIFQRGAVDGLNMVVPYGESEYYNLRRNIAIKKPNETGGAIDLDGYFGLHPSMKPFDQLWKDKRLAIVNAAGSPDNTRSHFDAQDYMESATPGRKSTPDGWLNRYLKAKAQQQATPFRAVALARRLPRSLMGDAPAIAMGNINEFDVRGGVGSASPRAGFEALYEGGVRDLLHGTGRETFEAVKMLKAADPARYQPDNGADYPRGPFGMALQQIAQLIKADI